MASLNKFIERSTDILKMATNAITGGPIWAFVWITRQCNQNCSHCYVWNNSLPHMDMTVFRQTVDKLRHLGVVFVSLFGGEPTLHPQLIEMIAHAKSSRRRIYLNTDLTAANTNLLIQTVQAGVDIISFSLDKVEPAAWNKRTTSAIDGKLDVLLHLRRQGYRYGLHCNVTWHKLNLHEGKRVIEYLLEKGNIAISVRPAVYPFPAPNTSARSKTLLLGKEDYEDTSKLIDWVIQKKRAGYPIINPYPYLKTFPNFILGDTFWDCGANRDILSIDVDGSVLQCSYFLNEVPQPFEPMRFRVENLTRAHLKAIRRISERNLSHCNSQCYSPAYFCTAYYRRHPIDVLRYYLQI
jgi:MoaA/NifB/PqqE/SkfB family radical SAM enzyme